MNKEKDIIVSSPEKRSFGLDIYWGEGDKIQPIILFAHGFKGFKDWGHWEKIAERFVAAGYCFAKFNFSHNGTTVDDPLNFGDLEAFGQNNYSKELDDLGRAMAHISEMAKEEKYNWDSQNITLIGHSRGGPIALIKAKEEAEVKRVITWASVHELNYAWASEEAVQYWRRDGVRYIMNGRTKQEMPQYFQLYLDYEQNQERFSVKDTLANLGKPYLIVHGSTDPAVPIDAAHYLQTNANEGTEMHLIDGGDHVFGGRHPFEADALPPESEQLVQVCLDFLQKPA